MIMKLRRRSANPNRKRAYRRVAALVAVCVGALMVLIQLPARAFTVPDPANPVTGNATWFSGLGAPYGGCGLPQANIDSQDFVALNVYNTPGDYNFYPRPLTGANASKIGMWNNGLNCGRWVQVKVSDYCTGVNDGAPNQAFCRNGSWVSDAYNGATLNMLVADSCGDSNGWCRDDPYHLDLSQPSLGRFVKPDGTLTTDLANHWNNRHISWQFIPAPNYSGDINIGFLQGAQVWWPAIAVSHLANGIHSVEYLANGTWTAAQMDSDMGQAYIIGGTSSGASTFQIRVRDVNDQLINGGRVYSFSLPSSCGSNCGPAYTQVSYTTSGGSTATPTSGPTSSAPPTSTPPTSAPPTSASPSRTTGSPATGACSASTSIVSSWQGGFQATVTVKAGTSPVNGWTAKWTLPSGVTISQLWSGNLTTSGGTATVTNVSWNGSLAANGSTTFGYTAGYTGSGSPPVPSMTCTSP
jgi:Cellulose binding domain